MSAVAFPCVQSPSPAKARRAATSAPQILLIDDDPVILAAMDMAFADAGWRTLLADGGIKGLGLFFSHAPDVVVTDIIMPDKEGIELILAMKAARPDTPIVAISGGGRTPAPRFLTLAEQLGADATLAKPFRFSELLAVALGLVAGEIAHVA